MYRLNRYYRLNYNLLYKRTNTIKSSSSSSTTKSGELSTDEKASEISKEAWPTLKKYLPIIIPFLTTTFYSVLVINNEKVKIWTEKYLPSYIKFIRDYHGFELEDLDEDNRIKNTIMNQMKPVNIVIEFDDGNQENIIVNGIESYDKLQIDLINKYNNLNIVNIYFKDDDNNNNNNNNNNGDDIKTHSTVESSIALDNIILNRSLWDFPITNIIKNDKLKTKSLLKPSLLSISSLSQQDSNKETDYLFIKSNVIDVYNNMLLSMFKGFNRYLELKKSCKLTIRTDTAVINQKSLKLKNTLKKVEYDTNMEILENQLKHLQAELKTGMRRSIENVEQDIQDVKKEISKLRRKTYGYFNWFYWF